MAIEGNVLPGKNPQLLMSHFTNDEIRIINRFAEEWYVTNGGNVITIGRSSEYKYFVICPTELYKELFNIEQEIIVVFSNYESFETRSLIAFEYICQRYPNLRIEKVCFVLISKDLKIENKIQDVLKKDAENQIVIPFYFYDLIQNKDSYYLRNQFKKYFFSRDLFAFQSPLKKDLYFFGRTDLVHKIVNRHTSHENSGIFGLRKTGKTSLIFGIQRVLNKKQIISVFIDCQNTSFHMRRWYKALYYIIEELKIQNKIQLKTHDESFYTEENGSICFEKDLVAISKKITAVSILLIFDEIERITYGVSPTNHWKDGLDFVFFWQTLRSIFQKHESLFTYLIVGTNPKCVETSLIEGQDNPIFSQIPFEYLPPFDVPQTREMVRKLGRIMGLKFDEIIYSKLTEDFGGHPFLIRIVCSSINQIASNERPVRVDSYLYEEGKKIFSKNNTNYIEMILTVLKEYYTDEFEMLKFLALGDIESFNDFAQLSHEYTNHLIGYNILDNNNNRFSIKIKSIKEYLESSNNYQKINLSELEMWKEISERRNLFETKLRKIVKQIMQIHLGDSKSLITILDIMGQQRKSKYITIQYKDIFNPNIVEIYLLDLKKIILSNWTFFENTFQISKQKFETEIDIINKFRNDAHAKPISKDDFTYFRVCMTSLEKQVDKFFE